MIDHVRVSPDWSTSFSAPFLLANASAVILLLHKLRTGGKEHLAQLSVSEEPESETTDSLVSGSLLVEHRRRRNDPYKLSTLIASLCLLVLSLATWHLHEKKVEQWMQLVTFVGVCALLVRLLSDVHRSMHVFLLFSLCWLVLLGVTCFRHMLRSCFSSCSLFTHTEISGLWRHSR